MFLFCFPFLSLSLSFQSVLPILFLGFGSYKFRAALRTQIPFTVGLPSSGSPPQIPEREGPRMCERDRQPASGPVVYQVEGSLTCVGPRAGRRITAR